MKMRVTRLIALWTTATLALLSCQAQDDNSTQTSTDMPKLIYVMDPHCGWCYGNSESVTQLQEAMGDMVEWELKLGGMLREENAQKGGEWMYNFISQHSPAMEKTTGAYVDSGYYELAQDTTYTFSSIPSSRAAVAVKSIAPEKTFDFVKAMQHAQFAEGKKIDELATFEPILDSLGIDEEAFTALWNSPENIEATTAEFASVPEGVNGFPTLLLEAKGGLHLVVSGYFEAEKAEKVLKEFLAD